MNKAETLVLFTFVKSVLDYVTPFWPNPRFGNGDYLALEIKQGRLKFFFYLLI